MRPRMGKTVIARFASTEAPAIITKVTDWEQSHRINVKVLHDLGPIEDVEFVRLFSCESSAKEFMSGNRDVRIVCYWPDGY